MNYYISGREVTKEDFYSQLEDDISLDCEYDFDDYLDDVGEEIELFGMTYSPSQVLQSVDPTAYRCMLADYTSERLEEAQRDLDYGEVVEANSSTYRIEEEDDEDDEE